MTFQLSALHPLSNFPHLPMERDTCIYIERYSGREGERYSGREEERYSGKEGERERKR